MGLLFNGFRQSHLTILGNGFVDGVRPSAQLTNWLTEPAYLNAMLHYDPRASVPDGVRHPVAWVMPRVAGGLSARNTITGSGGASAAAQSGQNIEAAITGSGGVSSGILGLIVSIAATISGSGGVSAAATQALATLTATLAGTGNITATAAGLAALTATLTGAGTITPNNTALMDITANIVGYGDATSQGIRDAVWSAAAAQFNAAGSMGAKLNAAGSGGVDLDALAAAVWAYATRTLTAADMPAEQQAQILEIWQRLGLDPAAPMTTAPTAITFGAETIDISEAAGAVTLTRQP